MRPDPFVSGTFYGRGGASTDGLGQSGDLRAEVPAGSTIVHAWLYSAATPREALPDSITFAEESIKVETINDDDGGRATRGDVTSIVAASVDSGGGIYRFPVIQPDFVQGTALVVIYSNPALPEQTIAILDGGSLPSGDSATFTFAEPVDPGIDGFAATLALGISGSFQDGLGSRTCGSGEVSLVDVNGRRLSSCAGNADDSAVEGLIRTDARAEP